MTFELFITIFITSAVASSFGIELIKTALNKTNIRYDSVPLAVIVSFIVGVSEIFIYYAYHGLEFSPVIIVYSICMGIANALASTTSYDMVKKFIYALFGKTE